MSQGNLVIGGLGVDAADGSKTIVNSPTAGRIEGGATIERSVETGFASKPELIFNLTDYDLTSARLVAEEINRSLGASAARAVDGTSIRINAPAGAEARVALMSRIENLEIVPAEAPARVIVNARTGTVVINGAVRVGPGGCHPRQAHRPDRRGATGLAAGAFQRRADRGHSLQRDRGRGAG
jgi:flagellar P-ring protein precursor FlgI